MKILSQIYVGDNKFLLSLLGDTKDLSNLPTEYAADASRFLNTDSNAVYVYTSADGWEITEAGQMKDLPVVSATDNGKVLKVANGVWSIGTDESGGSGGQFVVTFSGVDIEEGTVESADKTLAQIAEAIAADKPVVGFFSSEYTGDLWLQLVSFSGEGDREFCQFNASICNSAFSLLYGSDHGEPHFEISVIEIVEKKDVLEDTSLIVNLTLDGTGETPVLRGNKTYGEIKDAQFAGKHVILKGNLEDKGDFAASVIDAVYDAEANEVFITYAGAGALALTGGRTSDYVTIEVNQQGG